MCLLDYAQWVLGSNHRHVFNLFRQQNMGKTRGLIRFDKPLRWGWGIRGWQCWTAMFIGNQARHGQFKYLVASNNSPIPIGIWLCWGPFETLGQKTNHLPGYFQGCKTTYSKHFLYNLYSYTTISWNSTGITYLETWRKLGSLGCCTSLYNVQPGKNLSTLLANQDLPGVKQLESGWFFPFRILTPKR